jgi:hypothetical protein
MPEPRVARLSLGDVMVLIAAAAPSLVLIRTGASLGLFKLGELTERGGQKSSLARQLVEFFNVGGGCILAELVPGILILGLYRAYPSWRAAIRGPGLIACVVALAAAILPMVWFVAYVVDESRHPNLMYSVPFNNVFGRWMIAAGPMILGAWLALGLQGCWGPRASWADRAGCLVGACFVLIYLYSEVYFAAVLPILRLWKA